jgi:hypothetical protein
MSRVELIVFFELDLYGELEDFRLCIKTAHNIIITFGFETLQQIKEAFQNTFDPSAPVAKRQTHFQCKILFAAHAIPF